MVIPITNSTVFYCTCRSILAFFCNCCLQLSSSYSYLGRWQYLLKTCPMLHVKHPPGRAKRWKEQAAFREKKSATTRQNALMHRTRHQLRAPLSANSHAIPRLILNVKTLIVLTSHKNATEGMTAVISRMNLPPSVIRLTTHHQRQSRATCQLISDVTTAIAS